MGRWVPVVLPENVECLGQLAIQEIWAPWVTEVDQDQRDPRAQEVVEEDLGKMEREGPQD